MRFLLSFVLFLGTLLGTCTAQFVLTVNHGLTGTVDGMTVVVSPQVDLTTGQITSGNPVTAATFRPSNCNCAPEFKSGTFTGFWDADVTWQEVGTSSTYTLTGEVSNATRHHVPVVITFNNVTFDATGWSN